MKNIYSILVFLTFGLISCEEQVDSTIFRYGVETDFRKDVVYTSEDNALKIEIGKISDSRCPTGVVCIWQGEATVTIRALHFLSSSMMGDVTLSTFHNPTDTLGSTWSFKLLNVKPYPVYQQEVDSSSLVTTMVINRIKN